MNKAITDGLVLMPPAFGPNLSQWSREDGRSGQGTYQGASNAAFVPADAEFGGCLELLKTEGTQRLRFTGETPVLPGCYLRISARVKAVSGALPSVRVAAWAGGAGGVAVTGVPLTGPSTTLTTYGQSVEISAIVGTGLRTGVNMTWGAAALFGHFGLDLTGPNGGVVRIDDIRIEDITGAFHRKLMDWVDVRDYGAIGDGVADDSVAFEAADTAAAGRTVLVSAGLYRLAQNVTFESPVRFEGTVTMPADRRLSLTRNFDLPTYASAFNDEVEGFRRGWQALLSFSDHNEFDLAGRRIEVSAPIDMAAAAGVTTYAIRRVIRNGQFNVQPGAAWDTGTVTSAASYAASNPLRLTAVANAANIVVGARVTGTGVGREVYVAEVNAAAQTVTLSAPLFGPAGTQTYTFTRFRYVLDFSGFESLSRLVLDSIDFNCGGISSALILPPGGSIAEVRDCAFTRPRDRGITSPGTGCQGLIVDRCQFFSNEQDMPAPARTSVGINVNMNDAKIRDCRFARMGTTMVLSGSGHLITGNHWFQGDDQPASTRTAGVVFATTNVKSVLTGNYIDNATIEWTNEHDAEPGFSNEFSFGGLTLTGNIFTVNDVQPSFRWILVRPMGAGHYIQGMSVTGNVFKSINGNVDRIEGLNTSVAGLDFGRMRNIDFSANTFNGVTQPTMNPATLEFTTSTNASIWTLDVSGYLPFGGWSRTVDSVVAEGAIRNGANATVFAMPWVTVNHGAGSNQIRLNWPEPVRGTVVVTARTDKPV